MTPTYLPLVCVEPGLGHSQVAQEGSGTHLADLMRALAFGLGSALGSPRPWLTEGLSVGMLDPRQGGEGPGGSD